MDKADLKNLKRRYLVWFYKTAKESLDKIDRKFTQAALDRRILRKLKVLDKHGDIASFIADFSAYIGKKEAHGAALAYDGKKHKPEYLYLMYRLQAVEAAIKDELGKKALQEIKKLYETEMTGRILKSTEH